MVYEDALDILKQLCTHWKQLDFFTSSLATEISQEIDGYDAFISLFLEVLKGGAADIVGNITPICVQAYIDKAPGSLEQRSVFKNNVLSWPVDLSFEYTNTVE